MRRPGHGPEAVRGLFGGEAVEHRERHPLRLAVDVLRPVEAHVPVGHEPRRPVHRRPHHELRPWPHGRGQVAALRQPVQLGREHVVRMRRHGRCPPPARPAMAGSSTAHLT
uniref:hypothetical protein n=1 Tax=Nonomuraea pusilla TaxID=46177 RepID=UPI0006E3F8C1|nr:hypothetical protein [Nonomuraea pusilla]